MLAFNHLLFWSGEDEIRTRGTLIAYDSLANCWFQPLTHLSWWSCVEPVLFLRRHKSMNLAIINKLKVQFFKKRVYLSVK